jgi:hypothetical protein
MGFAVVKFRWICIVLHHTTLPSTRDKDPYNAQWVVSIKKNPAIFFEGPIFQTHFYVNMFVLCEQKIA